MQKKPVILASILFFLILAGKGLAQVLPLEIQKANSILELSEGIKKFQASQSEYKYLPMTKLNNSIRYQTDEYQNSKNQKGYQTYIYASDGSITSVGEGPEQEYRSFNYKPELTASSTDKL